MSRFDVDVAILGAGFGGSLMALLVERIGLRPVLVDRGHHPRFAIGESSTPVADFVLRDLTRTYGLPRIEPLARYGTWQRAYPELGCGLKRGFSYFRQEPHQPFAPRVDHANELLVTASSDDEHSDTHWLRADVDGFLAREAQQAGIPYLDDTLVSVSARDGGWLLEGRRHGELLRIGARFLIDATGEASVLVRALCIPSALEQVATNSRAVYAHFSHVQPWREHMQARGAHLDDHPFDCDNAALHQVIDEGWMWQLRFRNGILSAGFALDAADHAIDAAEPLEHEWTRWLERYPSLAAQFAAARLVQPPGGLRRTGRMQRRAATAAGRNWALLPNTAGFIDPLHSSGIAQTLCGIERLVVALAADWGRPAALAGEMECYSETVLRDLTLLDQLVSGCYDARRNFRLFIAFSMLYFAAATTYERRRAAGQLSPGAAFLCADDVELCARVAALGERLRAMLSQGEPQHDEIVQYERDVARALQPYNSAGLCDPNARNMYRYTVAR